VDLNEKPFHEEAGKLTKFAFSYGLSQMIQNIVFGALYYASAQLSYNYAWMNGEKLWIALFAMMFGAFATGNATAFGPDVKKANAAAEKIFTITQSPSDIDVLAQDPKAIEVKPEAFRGEIEFRDVWFRYPTRRNQWVFKGLNLKINAQDNIAIVGESGQGKSTMIALIMRFYDPDFGQVFIDGIDVREYNLPSLRERMGLVMQEPTLFNYSVKENILYGKIKASNA
jgi:ABC-type multidrug transport system fused ATPase/permease subunit